MRIIKFILAILLSIGVIDGLPNTLSSFVQLFYNFSLWHVVQLPVTIGFMVLIFYLIKSSMLSESSKDDSGTKVNSENKLLIGVFTIVTMLSALFTCLILVITGLVFGDSVNLIESSRQGPTDTKSIGFIIGILGIGLVFLNEKILYSLGLKSYYVDTIGRFHGFSFVARLLILIPFILYFALLVNAFIQ